MKEKHNTQQPAWWHARINGAHDAFFSELPPDDAYDEGTLTALYTAPPVPRDVLMAFGEEVASAAWKESREGFNFEATSLTPDVDIAALADRYASQVQPERNTITLEEMVAKLKAGENGDAISEAMTQATADMALGRAIREGRANQQDPANRQLLTAAKNSLTAADWQYAPIAKHLLETAIAAAEKEQGHD